MGMLQDIIDRQIAHSHGYLIEEPLQVGHKHLGMSIILLRNHLYVLHLIDAEWTLPWIILARDLPRIGPPLMREILSDDIIQGEMLLKEIQNSQVILQYVQVSYLRLLVTILYL